MIPRVKCLPVLPETVGEGAPKTRVNWALGERVSSCISELGYFEIGLWRLNKGDSNFAGDRSRLVFRSFVNGQRGPPSVEARLEHSLAIFPWKCPPSYSSSPPPRVKSAWESLALIWDWRRTRDTKRYQKSSIAQWRCCKNKHGITDRNRLGMSYLFGTRVIMRLG